MNGKLDVNLLNSFSLDGVAGLQLNASSDTFIADNVIKSGDLCEWYLDKGESRIKTATQNVITGESITAPSCDYITGLCPISNTMALNVYTRSTANCVSIIDVANSLPTSLGEKTFYTGSLQACKKIIGLSATTFVVIYVKQSTNGVYAKIGSISGGTLTFGSEIVLIANLDYHIVIDAIPIDTDNFLFVYGNNNSVTTQNAYICTISGASITVGTGYAYNTAYTKIVEIKRLDSTRFVLAYVCGGATQSYSFTIVTINGSVISFTTPTLVKSISNGYNITSRLEVLSKTKIVFLWTSNNTNDVNFIIYSISKDNSIVAGSTYAFFNNANISSVYDFSLTPFFGNIVFISTKTQAGGITFFSVGINGTVATFVPQTSSMHYPISFIKLSQGLAIAQDDIATSSKFRCIQGTNNYNCIATQSGNISDNIMANYW